MAGFGEDEPERHRSLFFAQKAGLKTNRQQFGERFARGRLAVPGSRDVVAFLERFPGRGSLRGGFFMDQVPASADDAGEVAGESGVRHCGSGNGRPALP